MTGHDDVFALLPAYALDAVEADEALAIAAHVKGCETCQHELASLQADVAALDRSVEAPETLWAKVHEAFLRRFPR